MTNSIVFWHIPFLFCHASYWYYSTVKTLLPVLEILKKNVPVNVYAIYNTNPIWSLTFTRGRWKFSLHGPRDGKKLTFPRLWKSWKLNFCYTRDKKKNSSIDLSRKLICSSTNRLPVIFYYFYFNRDAETQNHGLWSGE